MQQLISPLRNAWLGLVCRWVMGGVFLYASISKILDPQLFSFEVHAYELLPYYLVNFVALCLPWLELLVGLGLVLGVWTQACCAWGVILLVVFTGGVISAIERGLDISCGCFRGVGEMQAGWPKVLENCVMLAAMLLGWWARPGWMRLERWWEDERFENRLQTR